MNNLTTITNGIYTVNGFTFTEAEVAAYEAKLSHTVSYREGGQIGMLWAMRPANELAMLLAACKMRSNKDKAFMAEQNDLVAISF